MEMNLGKLPTAFFSAVRRQPSLRRIVSAMAIVSLVVTGSLVTAQPASAETRRVLGGLNFNVYCNAKYSVPIVATYGKGELFGGDVTKWRCVVHEWVGKVSGYGIGWMLTGIHSIDVNAACRTQYGRGDARATYRNFSDPYSWYCYYPVSYIG